MKKTRNSRKKMLGPTTIGLCRVWADLYPNRTYLYVGPVHGYKVERAEYTNPTVGKGVERVAITVEKRK